MPTKDIISQAEVGTLDGLFRERVRRCPETTAYREFDRTAEVWRSFSWREMAGDVDRWAAALTREGLTAGDRVAVALRNGRDWVLLDQAALHLGLIVVPLFPDDRPENAAYMLDDAGVSLLLLPDIHRWEHLAPHAERLSCLRRVLILEGETVGAADERVVGVEAWLGESAQVPAADVHSPDTVATIVYTSGTTGDPKGVMLTHRNILSVAEAGLQAVDVFMDDRFLSFLPLSHTFERTVGYYLPMMAGARVAFARSVVQLAEDITSQRPTILIAVPRIFERIYGRVQRQFGARGRPVQALFSFAVKSGWQRFEWEQGRQRWSPMVAVALLWRRSFGRSIQQRLGGALRLVISGGAPLAPEIAHFFLGLGLPLLQGYGLTESGPQVAVNRVNDNDPASVGRPLPSMEVKIGEKDELLVRSPGVMKGYWHRPADTEEALEGTGWLHTGDQARLQDGRIYITGRIKDVLVLSNGEKVPPAEMETAIVLDPLFEQVMIVGEGKPFLSLLAVLNRDEWTRFAKGLNVASGEPASLNARSAHRAVLKRVSAALHHFPSYAKVRRLHLQLEPWTIDNGLLTPSMKLRRTVITVRYAEELDRLYEQPH